MDNNHIKVTNQKELDEFLNNSTNDISDYCVDIWVSEPLDVKTKKVKHFNIYYKSKVAFVEVPDDSKIYAYNDALAIMESKNDLRVYGFNNSTIFNLDAKSILSCELYDNAKFENSSLNSKTPSGMLLRVVNISTQERLDECVKLYQNYDYATFFINQSCSETGSELVVNKKIDGVFELRGENRVVFKSPTNSDNESIDYWIHAFGKSTAILETNKCKVFAYNEATIIKRCKDDIAYKYIEKNAKLVDESHLLDTNKHKETSKGRGK